MTDGDRALEPGSMLSDRYRLEAELGRGGAGRVFRAHDDRLDRAVAVKVLTDLGQAAVARFRREAATAARIRHPNVVTLHDAGVDGAPYLVMSLVEGPSLAARVEADGTLDAAALHRLAVDLFGGLEATHEAGVLHRDLTPRNILFDHDGTALLADFGIARGADDPTITAEHTIMGTRPFVAPERLRGQDATVAADVYAVGVTLRYAATGSHGAAMPARHPFAELVAACTQEDPGRRPASAADAARHAEALAPDTGTGLPATQALPPAATTTLIRREPAGTAGRAAGEGVHPASRPEMTTASSGPTASARGRRRDGARPVVVVGLLAALAVAAIVGSSAVRDDGSGDPATGATPATDAPAGGTTAPDTTADGEQAPTFDPDAPGASARRLAEWLRSRDG